MLINPIKISLEISLISSALSVIIGYGFVVLLQGRRNIFKKIIEGIISLSLFLSPTILGYILLLSLGKNGFMGSVLSNIGVDIIFTKRANIISCVVVSLPLAYQSIKAGFLGIDKIYYDVSLELGANRRELYRYIVLPLIKNNLIIAWILSFGRSFGEFGASLMLAGNIPNKTQTIPMAVYSLVESGRITEANILLLVTIGVGIASMSGVAYILRRSEE